MIRLLLVGLYIVSITSLLHPIDQAQQTHISRLAYLEFPHPKAMLLFSGAPGMGKSTIAWAIEARLHAVRISSDEGRELLRRQGMDPEARSASGERLLDRYLASLIGQVERLSPNGLFVIDGSCDRLFSVHESAARDAGYQLLLVRCIVPRNIVETRLKARGSIVSAADLDGWLSDYETLSWGETPCFFFNGLAPFDEEVDRLTRWIEEWLAIFYKSSTATIGE